MTGFSFDATAGTSQSTVRPELEGNSLHEVSLDKVEFKEIESKKTGDKYEILEFTFGNDSGNFSYSVFGPTKPEQFQRSENEYKDKKTGETKTFPKASAVEDMMLTFKHIIDAYAPLMGKAIDEKKKSLSAPNFKGICAMVEKILAKAITDKNTSTIKLIKDKEGKPRFPGFFTSVNSAGVAYIKNNFIGNKVAFSDYEADRINNEATAKPTNMKNDDLNFGKTDEENFSVSDDIDLDLSVEGEDDLPF